MRLLTGARSLVHRAGIDITRWPHRPEDGVIDWARVIGILRDTGWSGVLSCECGTSEQAVRSLAHLQTVMQTVEAPAYA